MKRMPPPRLPKAKPDALARGKFYLTYPKKLVKEPLIYQMSRKFDLVFNVRSASVSEEIGIIALELDGRQEEIDAASSGSAPRASRSSRSRRTSSSDAERRADRALRAPDPAAGGRRTRTGAAAGGARRGGGRRTGCPWRR